MDYKRKSKGQVRSFLQQLKLIHKKYKHIIISFPLSNSNAPRHTRNDFVASGDLSLNGFLFFFLIFKRKFASYKCTLATATVTHMHTDSSLSSAYCTEHTGLLIVLSVQFVYAQLVSEPNQTVLSPQWAPLSVFSLSQYRTKN